MRRYVNSRGNPFIKCEDGDVHENVVKNVNSRFFNLFSVLFQVSYYLKCKGTLLELNSLEPYLRSERERKFCLCLKLGIFKSWPCSDGMMRVQSLLFRLLSVVTLDVFPKDPCGEIAWAGFASLSCLRSHNDKLPKGLSRFGFLLTHRTYLGNCHR